VPGMGRGDADVKWNPVSLPRSGRVQGYLSPDQWAYYGFVPWKRVPFSYAPGDQRPADAPEACAD
jgi:hypothetical protein